MWAPDLDTQLYIVQYCTLYITVQCTVYTVHLYTVHLTKIAQQSWAGVLTFKTINNVWCCMRFNDDESVNMNARQIFKGYNLLGD